MKNAWTIVASVILLGGVFFLGRGQSRSFREDLRGLKGELEEIASGTAELKELTERERELIGSLVEQNKQLSERVEIIVGGVDVVTGIVREQQDLIASIGELDTGSGEALDSLGDAIGESLSILEQLTQVPQESDLDNGDSSGRN